MTAKERNKIVDLIVANMTDVDKPAIESFTGEVLTYGALVRFIELTQAALERFNIKPRQRIGFISDNPLAFPVLLGIIETAGLTPLDPSWNNEQYLEYFDLLSIDCIMTDIEGGTAIDAAMSRGIGVIKFQVLPRKTVNFELAAEVLVSSGQPYKNDQIAAVYTTSGSTSTPKVVPRIYEDLWCNFKTTCYDLQGDSIQLLPFRFYIPLGIVHVLSSLLTNSLVVFTDGFSPARIVAALEKYRVTHFVFQPAGMIALIEYMEKNRIEFSHPHAMDIVVAGAMLPEKLRKDVERHFDTRVINAYGMNEVGYITSTAKAPNGFKEGSVGCPLRVAVRIHEGEIQIKGPSVFRGYENNPEANAIAFEDGWFRTGDAGYIDEDGCVFITGRIKELINRGGEKVSPAEVEQAIMSLGNIRDVCVFPYLNSKGFENVGAAIVSDGEVMGLKELRGALKERIKPFKLPTIMYRVDQIPTSAANKVQRNFLHGQLQELCYVAETLGAADAVEDYDLTQTQLVIQEIWKDILEQEYISIDDNFFDIGGDSLSAAEVLAAIETGFGCMLPVNDFFARSTIRELAELVDHTPKSNPYKHLVPIRRGGAKCPLFFVHERSGDVVTYHHIVDHIDRERPVYGLNLNLSREGWGPATTMREIARAYAGEVRMVWETGPYYLVGLSVGGQIAFEMGAVLAERGLPVVVFMMDTWSHQHVRNTEIYKSIRSTLLSLKKVELPQLPKLVGKKARTLYQYYIVPKLSVRGQPKDMERFERKWEQAESFQDRQAVVLRAAINGHQPAQLPGKVCYFRALRDRLKRNDSYLFWQSVSGEFVLIEKDLWHDGFVKPEHAADTAAEIMAVIEGYEGEATDLNPTVIVS